MTMRDDAATTSWPANAHPDDWPIGDRVPDEWVGEARGGMVVVTLYLGLVIAMSLGFGWLVLLR